MPLLFLSSLIGALASAMGSFVGRAVLALGIGTVTYTGISVSLNAMKSNLIGSVNSLPVDVLNLMGYLWVDKALTIIFSAVSISLSMKLISGGIKKMVIK